MFNFIKETFRTINKIIKINFILLLGVGLFIYSLFNFSSNRYCDNEGTGRTIRDLLNDRCTNPSAFYYYKNIVLVLLTIGAIFIIIGILKIKEEKNERKN